MKRKSLCVLLVISLIWGNIPMVYASSETDSFLQENEPAEDYSENEPMEDSEDTIEDSKEKGEEEVTESDSQKEDSEELPEESQEVQDLLYTDETTGFVYEILSEGQEGSPGTASLISTAGWDITEENQGYLWVSQTIAKDEQTYQIVSVGETAFADLQGDKKITIIIPDSIQEINFLDSDFSFVCGKGSAMENYAKERGFSYIVPQIESQTQEKVFSKGKNEQLLLSPFSSLSFPQQEITWSSSDESIAEISPEGILKGVAEGSAVITAQAGGIAADLEIKVTGQELLENASDDLPQYTENGWTIRQDGMVMGISYSHSIEIPETIAGIRVTGLRNHLFFGYIQLRSVKIPDSVEDIGSFCFYNCYNIEELILPSHLKTIGNNAFQKTGFKSILIPKGVTKLPNNAFDSNGDLSTVVFEGPVTEIGDAAFSNCASLSTLEFPDTLKKVGDYAFYKCRNYDPEVGQLEQIGSYSFAETGIKTAQLSEGITCVPKGAFNSCLELKSLSMSPQEMEEKAFDGCVNLQEVSLGEKLKKVDGFNNCSELTSIDFPEGTTEIGGFANTALVSVEIPQGVTSISGQSASLHEEGTYIFEGCSNLERIDVDPENQTYQSIDGVLITRHGFSGKWVLERYPEGKSDISTYVLPEEINGFSSRCFMNCSNLSQIVIENHPDFSWNTTGIDFSTSDFQDFPSLMGLKVDASVSFHIDTEEGEQLMPDFEEGVPQFTIYGEKGSEAEEFANAYGYPFHSPEDFVYVEAQVADDRLQVQVMDEDGMYLEGVSVTIEDKETITNDSGIAVFDSVTLAKTQKRKITLKKAGYQTKTAYRKIGFSMGLVIQMVRSDGNPYVSSVFLNGEADLLTDKVVIEKTSEENERDTLEITAEIEGEKPALYEIIQENKPVLESSTGTIHADLSDELSQGKPVYVRVRSESGKISKPQMLSLTVMGNKFFSSIPEQMEVSLDGGEFSATIPESILKEYPWMEGILGGATIKKEFLENDGKELLFPLTIECSDDGKIRLGLNIKKGKLSMDELEDFYKQAVKDQGIDKNKWDKLQKEAHGEFLNASVKGQIMGYGEGYINPESKENTTINFNLGVFAVIEGTGGITHPFLIGNVPVYWTSAFSVKSALDSGNYAGTFNIQDGLHITSYGNTSLESQIKLSIGGGIGYYKQLSAGLTGGGTVKDTFYFSNESGVFEAGLNLGYQIFIAGFEVSKDFLEACEKTNWRITYSKNQNDVKAEATHTEESADFRVEEIDRDYLNEYKIINDKNGTTIEGIYPNAQPKQVVCQGETYLFWLEDDQSRESMNRSRLVYAKVGKDGTLGEIRGVEDDGTGDFDFQVKADDKAVYIVWQDAAHVLEQDTTLEEQLTDLELTLGKWEPDGDTWKFVNITENTETSNIDPRLSIYADKLGVTWDTLDGADYFAQEVQPQMRSMTVSKDLEILHGTEWTGDGVVMSQSSGNYMGKEVCVYSLDTDKDLNTVQDRVIQMVDTAEGTVWKSLETPAEQIQLINLEGKDLLFFSSQGRLHYTWDMKEIETAENISLPQSGSDFQIESYGGKTYLYFQSAQANGEHTEYTIYVSRYQKGKWDKPIAVYSSESPMTNLCFSEGKEGTGVIMFLTSEGGITSLKTIAVGQQEIFLINSVNCLEENGSYGEAMPLCLSLSNPGSRDISQYEIQVMRKETSIYNKTITEPLPAYSENQKVVLEDFSLPADLAEPETFTVRIAAGENQRETSFIAGYTDLSLVTESYLENGKNRMNLQIANNSPMDTGGVLKVYRVEDQKTPIYEKKLEKVSKGTPLNVMVDMDALEKLYDITTVRVVLEAEKEEQNTADNQGLEVIHVLSQESTAKKITLDKTTAVMYVGEKVQLQGTVTPSREEEVPIVWTSADESVAQVTQEGLVIPKKKGRTRIVCSYQKLSAVCYITVKENSTHEITEEVSNWKELESDHDTEAKFNKTWVYQDTTQDSIAIYLKMGLSGYDTLEILDKENQVIDTFSATGELVKIQIPGDTIKIHFIKNGEKSFGFQVLDYGEYLDGESICTRVENLEDFQSEHPYKGGIDHSWVYKKEGAGNIQLELAEETGLGYNFSSWNNVSDHLYVYDGDGRELIDYTYLDINNSSAEKRKLTVHSDTVRIRLKGSHGDAYGFKVDKLAANDPGVLISGKEEYGLEWRLKEDGTLEISGNCEMKTAPWMELDYRLQEKIRRVIIQEGITSVSENAFQSYFNLEEVSLPNTVTKIGRAAFSRSGLTSIRFPASVKEMGDYVLSGCWELRDVILEDDFTAVNSTLFDFGGELLAVFAIHIKKGTAADEAVRRAGLQKYIVYTQEIGRVNDISGYYTNGEAGVYWEPVRGASDYEIYRIEGQNKTLAGIVSQKMWMDSGYLKFTEAYEFMGGSYAGYQVRARKSLYQEPVFGEFSEVLEINTSSEKREWEEFQQKTLSVTAKPVDYDSVNVSWEPQEHADGYYVYCKEPGVTGWIRKGTVTGSTSFSIHGLKTGTNYLFTAKAFWNTEKGEICTKYKTDISATPVLKTTVVKVSGLSYNTVQISWDKVVGADGYYVYRKDTRSDSKWQRIGYTTSNSYKYAGAVCEKTYYYTAKAARKVGTREVYGAYPQDVTCATSLGTTKVKAVYMPNNTVQISWEKLAGAIGYFVYRRNIEEGSKWEKLGATKGATFIDTKGTYGKSYYYTAKAYTKGESSYVYSNYPSNVICKLALAKTQVAAGYTTNNTVQISWKKVAGASGYFVYRKETEKGSTWQRIGVTGGTTFKDTKGIYGKTYYYTVKAYGYVKDQAVYSEYPTNITCKLQLSQTQVTASCIQYDTVQISWKKIAGASGYFVYRKDTEKGSIWQRIAVTAGTSFKDTKGVYGKTYYYTVKAYGYAGKTQVYGTYPQNVTAKAVLMAPQLHLKSSQGRVTISWNQIKGATGYLVYRNTGVPGSKWERLTPSAVKGDVFSYTDSSAETGKTYYYTVKALRIQNGKTLNGEYLTDVFITVE